MPDIINFNWDWNIIINKGIDFGISALIALGLWFFGKLMIKILSAALSRTPLDDTVRKFIVSALRILLYMGIILVILDAFGINTNSLVAIISALGLSLSLALKDNISGIADGVFLLVARPFNVDDCIEVDGISGKVKRVSVYYTTLVTEEKTVMIPNSKISKAVIMINNMDN